MLINQSNFIKTFQILDQGYTIHFLPVCKYA